MPSGAGHVLGCLVIANIGGAVRDLSGNVYEISGILCGYRRSGRKTETFGFLFPVFRRTLGIRYSFIRNSPQKQTRGHCWTHILSTTRLPTLVTLVGWPEKGSAIHHGGQKHRRPAADKAESKMLSPKRVQTIVRRSVCDSFLLFISLVRPVNSYYYSV